MTGARLLLGVTLLVVVCGSPALSGQSPVPPDRADIGRLAWLTGTWLSPPGGPAAEERWTPADGGAMLGLSRTVAGGRMVAFEFMRIVERDGGLVFVAQPGGRAPTEFVLTAIGDRRAVFENPAHDFPKVIDYALDDDGTLRVTISDTGGRQAQVFRFRRQDGAERAASRPDVAQPDRGEPVYSNDLE